MRSSKQYFPGEKDAVLPVDKPVDFGGEFNCTDNMCLAFVLAPHNNGHENKRFWLYSGFFSGYFSCIDVCCNFISKERELLEPHWGSLKSVTLSIIAHLFGFKMSSATLAISALELLSS